MGKINWDPYLPTILTVVMRNLDFPLGSIKLPPSHNNELSSKSAIFFRALPDKFKVIGKLLVNTIHQKSKGLAEIEKLFQMIESFYNPSNAGKWTLPAAKFLNGFAEEFANRMHEGTQLAKNQKKKMRNSKSHFFFPLCNRI